MTERKAAGRNRKRFDGVSDEAIALKAERLRHMVDRFDRMSKVFMFGGAAILLVVMIVLAVVAEGTFGVDGAGDALRRLDAVGDVFVSVLAAYVIFVAALSVLSLVFGLRAVSIVREIERRHRDAPAEGGADEGWGSGGIG